MQELVEYTKSIYYNTEYIVQSNIIYVINFIKTSDEQTLILVNLMIGFFCTGCLNLYTSLIIGLNQWEVFQLIIYYVMSFILCFMLGIINNVVFTIINRSDNPIDWLISIQELRQREFLINNMPIAVDITRIHEHTD